MAQCGYLAAIALEHLAEDGNNPDALTQIVSDVIDFTNLYYAYSGKMQAETATRPTREMVLQMAQVGQGVHADRTIGFSDKNALTLSNRLLKDCRTDLRQLAAKLGGDLG